MASNHHNFRNLHRLIGIQHTDVMPSHPMPVAVVAHPVPMGNGLYASSHPHIVAMGNGLYSGSGGGLGTGLYSGASGGKLSKIGQAFNKAFNPQKNGVAKAVTQAVNKTIVAPIQHDLVNPIVNTANQVKTGFNKTFNPALGNEIVSDLKTGARYGIPALTGFVGGTLGGLATGGLGGQVVGSAGGAYAGYKINQALGIENNNDFVGVPKPKGMGIKPRGRPRKMKGEGNVKQELEKIWDKVPHGLHTPLEDLGRASLELSGYKLPPKKRTPVGKGVKGSKSKSRKGDLNYTTKKGDKYFHREGHLETDSDTGVDSDSNKVMGTGIKKRKVEGKGTAEMKEKMARLRAMRGKKVKGGEIHQLPIANHVRLSPYQNF